MKVIRGFLFLLLTISSVMTFAGPRTGFTEIIEVRPYFSGDVFVKIGFAPSWCQTTTFKISKNSPGRKEMYTAVLAAMMNSSQVSLEINLCNTPAFGTPLISVYVKP